MIYVALVSNLTMPREGIKRILQAQDDIDVIAELDNISEVESNEKLKHCALLVVITYPGVDGNTSLPRLYERNPLFRFIHIVRSPSLQQVIFLLRSGAHGLLDASCAVDHLPAAIRTVWAGRVYMHEEIGRMVAGNLNEVGKNRSHTSLTHREFEIFIKLAAGQRISDIAGQLGISVKTVSTHKTRLMEKMGVSTQAQLVLHAVLHGLFEDHAS